MVGCLKPWIRPFIIVLPKPGKDPRLCEWYRPISLLSSEYKILTKIIATRLEQVIPSLVNVDQTVFIHNRSLSENVRRLFNIIHCAKSMANPVIAISLDAEKAFDHVEWHSAVLEEIYFSPNILRLICILYLNPTAMIQTNTVISTRLPLSPGTRQGCPLSPLIVALIIEPLPIAVWSQNFYLWSECRA